eukprot:2293604-Heterocapsa_arctica.AAC.1
MGQSRAVQSEGNVESHALRLIGRATNRKAHRPRSRPPQANRSPEPANPDCTAHTSPPNYFLHAHHGSRSRSDRRATFRRGSCVAAGNVRRVAFCSCAAA